MEKRVKSILAGIVFLGMTGITHADHGIEVNTGGSGCPAGTARVVSLGDSRYSVELDEFEVQSEGARIARKSCQIAILGAEKIRGIRVIGELLQTEGTEVRLRANAFVAGEMDTLLRERVFRADENVYRRVRFDLQGEVDSFQSGERILRIGVAMTTLIRTLDDFALGRVERILFQVVE